MIIIFIALRTCNLMVQNNYGYPLQTFLIDEILISAIIQNIETIN